MPHCPDCGETIGTSQKFCQSCGNSLEEFKRDNHTNSTGNNDSVSNSTESVRSETDHIAKEHGAYVTPARIKKVVDILDEDEQVHFLTRGSTIDVEGSSAGTSLFGDDRSRKSGTKGYVRAAITNKRVAVKIPQWLGNDERSVPYNSITSVDLDTGLVTKRLSLQTPGQTYHIEAHEPGKEECRRAVRFIRDKLSESSQQQIIEPKSPDPDPTEQLKNLKELHGEGVLTDEEFEAKKQSILDKL